MARSPCSHRTDAASAAHARRATEGLQEPGATVALSLHPSKQCRAPHQDARGSQTAILIIDMQTSAQVLRLLLLLPGWGWVGGGLCGLIDEDLPAEFFSGG